MTDIALGPGIYAFLSDALSVGERIYPLRLPQGATLPALTYQLVSEETQVDHSTQQDHPTYTGRRYEESRVQFNAYGETFDDAEALSNELKSVITGFRGLWGDVKIDSVLPALSLDDFEPETGKWRRITDFFVKWIGGQSGS